MNEIAKIIKEKIPKEYIYRDGQFGGTSYYYLIKNKLYLKYIPNNFNEPISYAEIPIPDELTGEGKINITLVGVGGNCIADIWGAHIHIYSEMHAYCPYADLIFYIGV